MPIPATVGVRVTPQERGIIERYMEEHPEAEGASDVLHAALHALVMVERNRKRRRAYEKTKKRPRIDREATTA
jgi:hypothetical protein